MSLKSWRDNDWLSDHQATRGEIADLLAVIDRDIADARIDRLSADWRLGISYNACLQLANLALAASGYRPNRQRAHERAIQSLRLTIELDQAVVDTLDAIRRKRHLSNYERAGATSSAEADEVYGLAQSLRERVLVWLKIEHPELLSDT
jgi:hypothetical protein